MREGNKKRGYEKIIDRLIGNNTMAVYLIAEIEIKDLEMYSRYVEKVPEVIERFGGRYLSQGG